MKVLLFSLIFSFSAYSQYGDSEHQLGIVVDSWKYTEPRIKDSGFLFGIHYRYQTEINSFFNWIYGVELLLGQTEYDGETLEGAIPVTADQTNTIFSTHSLFQANISSLVQPLIGIYFRFLRDEDDENTGDYQRDQEYLTFPIGLRFGLSDSILTILYHSGFQGKNKTFLTDVGGNRDLSLDQDEGSGIHIEWEYLMGNQSISIFYRTWNVEDSERKQATVPDVNGGVPSLFVEPENETTSFGLKFNTLF